MKVLKKVLWTVLICIATIYAPVELTRVIIDWGIDTELIFELAFMWAFYLTAITLVAWRVR